MSNSYYNYSGNFIPGTLARAEAVSAEFNSVAQGFSKLSVQGVDTGTVNHVVFATTGYPVAAYNDGNNLQFRVLFSNTGPTDINVNGIGAVPLLRFNGTPLVAGDLSAGSWYIAIYEAAFGGFTILSPAAYSTFAGSISLAAPTFKVGLVAAAGSSTAAAPIDVKFAIDQSISPTWTGSHLFTSTTSPLAIGAVNTNKLSGDPFHMLEITQLNVLSDQPSMALSAYGPTSGGLFANEIHWNRYNGTMASPTALLSGDPFGSMGGRGWDGTANLSQSAVGVQAYANENWSSTNHGTYWNFFVTPSGGSVTRINTLQMSSTVAGGNQFDVMTSGTGDSSVGLLRFMDQGGTRYGYMGKSAAGVIAYESDAKLSMQANGGADKLEITTAHVLNYNSGVFTVGGSGNVAVAAPASGVSLSVTGVAGSSAAQFLTTGIQVGSPTGGDKGAGTVNVSGNYYINGTVLAAGVTSITGTANQIAASASTGAVTLSMPNNVIIPTPPSGTALAITGASSSASTSVTMVGGVSSSTTQTVLAITGAVGATVPAMTIVGGSGVGATGLQIGAGVASTDTALLVTNRANSLTLLSVFADGSVTTGANTLQGGGTIAATQLYVGTLPMYRTGTFTGTLTGMSAGGTGTVSYVISGNTATLQANFTGTSNSTSMTMTGLPAVLQPATLNTFVACSIEDNNADVVGGAIVTHGSGTITFLRDVLATGNLLTTGFTASGVKGFNTWSITYMLL